ncbi:MAG: alpha/beta hydrolase family protein [Fermentimonas sp.]
MRIISIIVVAVLLKNLGIISNFHLQAQQISGDDKVVKFDDTRKVNWDNEFELVQIKSSEDQNVQKAYFYKSKSKEKMPLLVSLHSWSGDYAQQDSLAEFCRINDINYIHPDFRGPNNTPQSCGSSFVVSDINDAIDFVIENANVDTDKISVIGSSGGGYATLCCFMNLERKIHKFSAWVPITDLIAWYHESTIRKNKYAKDILDCIGKSEKGDLDEEEAKKRSPIFLPTPLSRVPQTKLFIYTGIYDGIQGSVPITHSINFYNKLLRDLSEKNFSKYVSDSEKLELLEFRKPIGEFGYIANRRVCLQKETKNIKLTIFEGGHEMLTEYAFHEILND